jgi:acetate kinase
MESVNPSILAINSGSSSIRFALYQTTEPLQRTFYGKVDRIGLSGTNLSFTGLDGKQENVGISETSFDMRDLLALEMKDIRAAEAVALFCYQTKKWVGAFAAALGGLDTLVFSAGIGENCPSIRRRICDGLGFLGINLSETRNQKNEAVISSDESRVIVRVILTDEELMIARSVNRILDLDK